MSTSIKGEVPVEINGTVYTLSMAINALVLLEQQLGRGFMAEFQSGEPSYTTIRMAFWAALNDHHPDIELHAAGLLMARMGMKDATKALVSAMHLGMGTTEPTGARGAVEDKVPRAEGKRKAA